MISETKDISERALGVVWNLHKDVFTYKIQWKSEPLTNRGVLSVIFSIYDPFGFVGPALFMGKLIFQQLCSIKIDWDDAIPEDLILKWKEWIEALPLLSNYEVQRCIKPVQFSLGTSDIHIFGDASKKGLGSVAYIRNENSDTSINCSILMAKTRIAPLKKVTIPRLELSASQLCITIGNMLKRELNIKVRDMHFWTDSMIVLKCINNDKRRFPRFVANRIGFIRDHSSPQQWHYVPSDLNPADFASRGMDIEKFLENKLWKNGPDFLWQTLESWPKENETKIDETNEINFSTNVNTETIANPDSNSFENPIKKLICISSTWEVLLRKVAWLLKIKVFLKERTSVNEKLRFSDLQDAENLIVAYVQQEAFQKEFSDVKSQGYVNRNSSLRVLCPYIDDKNLLRVKGRTEKANISSYTKHPLILPKHHRICDLIARSIHRQVGHLGRESTLYQIRQKFWIIHANSLVRNIVKHCLICRIIEQKPCEQIMANLPF